MKGSSYSGASARPVSGKGSAMIAQSSSPVRRVQSLQPQATLRPSGYTSDVSGARSGLGPAGDTRGAATRTDGAAAANREAPVPVSYHNNLPADVATADSRVRVWAVATNEEISIARSTYDAQCTS